MEPIDKKVNEILNQELGISAYEMALPRKKVIDKIKAYSEVIVEHLIKCVVYGKNLGIENYRHWKDEEICRYCELINSYEVKDSKKLKKEDYEKFLLENNGTSESDYYSEIVLFRLRNLKTGKYPDFKPTRLQGRQVYTLFLLLISKISPILADSNKTQDFNFRTVVNQAFVQAGLE